MNSSIVRVECPIVNVRGMLIEGSDGIIAHITLRTLSLDNTPELGSLDAEQMRGLKGSSW